MADQATACLHGQMWTEWRSSRKAKGCGAYGPAVWPTQRTETSPPIRRMKEGCRLTSSDVGGLWFLLFSLITNLHPWSTCLLTMSLTSPNPRHQAPNRHVDPWGVDCKVNQSWWMDSCPHSTRTLIGSQSFLHQTNSEAMRSMCSVWSWLGWPSCCSHARHNFTDLLVDKAHVCQIGTSRQLQGAVVHFATPGISTSCQVEQTQEGQWDLATNSKGVVGVGN